MGMLAARAATHAAARLVFGSVALWGQPGPATDPLEALVVDRIVALVDEAPVFESDLEMAEALGTIPPEEEESRDHYRRRLLDRLIDDRLRYAAVRRQGYEQLHLPDIEQQIRMLTERFGGTGELRRVLSESGMDLSLLRAMIARQLVVWDFVQNRLGARVFVELEEIERHYEGEFTGALEAMGQPVPPLREVREQIREVLYQRKLNQELERWTAELRFQADVSTYLDRG